VISTDKGLAGALNTNLLREARGSIRQDGYVVAGRKAANSCPHKTGPAADFELKDAPTFVETKPISNFVIEKFLKAEVDKVSVLFTHSLTRSTNGQWLKPYCRSAHSICRRAKLKRAATRCSAMYLNRNLRRCSIHAALLCAIPSLPKRPGRACVRTQCAHGGNEERDR